MITINIESKLFKVPEAETISFYDLTGNCTTAIIRPTLYDDLFIADFGFKTEVLLKVDDFYQIINSLNYV